MDPFSPLAAACVPVLVVPVGSIDREQFRKLLGRLQYRCHIIKLADIEPYVANKEFAFSPSKFLQASILYNFTTCAASQQQEHLSPFELFRAPLCVLGVADHDSFYDPGITKQELDHALSALRERHPQAIHRHVLSLQFEELGSEIPKDAAIARWDGRGDSALQDAICQFSARFLEALPAYTTLIQSLPNVQTPGQTARSLQRTASQREQERRPVSGTSTPTHSKLVQLLER